MPYIKKDSRLYYDLDIENLIVLLRASSNQDGDLNYVLSRIVSGTVANSGGFRYKDIAKAVGALECAKLEFYRRVGSLREDQAIKENGDILEYLPLGEKENV